MLSQLARALPLTASAGRGVAVIHHFNAQMFLGACGRSSGRAGQLCGRAAVPRRKQGMTARAVFEDIANNARLYSAASDDEISESFVKDLPCWPYSSEYLAGCEPHKAPQRVAVLLSGGVDSSLALSLLKAAGHQVHAFYLQIWFQEDFRNFWDQCPWEEDLAYAQKVCDQHGVPLDVVPLTKEYWDLVVSHCVNEIKNGRTPNPDVLCNSRVKFGAFYDHLNTKFEGQFDRVASGHYARLHRPAEEAAEVDLMLTPDEVKDQTYFLAHLSQQQLSRVLFPVGHFTKGQVRQLAQSADLPNKSRKDSQGICFLGKVKFSEFIKEHLGVWKGPIIEEESNEVVAYHDGFWFYTIGQRSGLNLGHLPNGPWYVVRKDPVMNAVYVSMHYFAEDKVRNAFTCDSFNWITAQRPLEVNAGADGNASPLYVKVRHGPNMYRCKVFEFRDSGSSAFVQLPENDQGLAAGQFAVFYRGGVCLGSGVITAGLSVVDSGNEGPAAAELAAESLLR